MCFSSVPSSQLGILLQTPLLSMQSPSSQANPSSPSSFIHLCVLQSSRFSTHFSLRGHFKSFLPPGDSQPVLECKVQPSFSSLSSSHCRNVSQTCDKGIQLSGSSLHFQPPFLSTSKSQYLPSSLILTSVESLKKVKKNQWFRKTL